MKKIKIGNKFVGEGEQCFIIAEAGANHDRKLNQAKKLIDVAVDAEADAVKFQTYSAETLYSKKTQKMSYLEKITDEKETVWDLIKKIEMPREWLPELADYAKSSGIIFLSTPFDFKAVDELDAVGVAAFKIASFEIVDLPLLEHVAKKKKPMILSTGMCDMQDIEDALESVYATGNKEVILLHCAINYPPKLEDVNLRAMKTMEEHFKVPVGFSDHTLGINIAIAAAAMNAKVIEKHFTIDRNLPGPDHPFALEPDELKQMVKGIREVELSLGDGVKKMAKSEEEMHRLARRSVIAAKSIKKGETISREMLTVKRPGYGIKPKFIEKVVGRKAKKDIEEDEVITWKMLE